MKQLVQSLVEVISAFGNPLEDDYSELIFKVTRLCPLPPSLSDFGKLSIGQKSALLTCIDFGVQTNLHISLTVKYLMVQQLSTFCLQLVQ